MSTLTLPNTHRLDVDTQAILLLCGWFGEPPAAGAPLSITEYNTLGQWLLRQGLRPGDLLTSAWQRIDGVPVSVSRLQALLGRGVALALAVENWTNQGLWIISRSDPAYPPRLKTYLGRLAPPILYGAGAAKDRIPDHGLAVVGARAADDAALAYTGGVARACAAQEIPIISGGARGVDTTAMEAVLTEGGQVIGMLADSLARSASSKRFRQALIEGRLTLLSPFNPMAGFSTGNAMARNKYIYALAQWSLIVSAGMNEGGTWAGAVEALRAGRVPVFVRLQDDVPEGNRRLAELGARSFPEAPWADLAAHLDAASLPNPGGGSPVIQRPRKKPVRTHTGQLSLVPEPTREGSPESAVPEPSPAPTSGTAYTADREAADMRASGHTAPHPPSIFDAVWPVLAAHLQEPRALQELAAMLQVRPAQLQEWLDRGLQEGRVCKKARPVRYAVQPALFPRRGTPTA